MNGVLLVFRLPERTPVSEHRRFRKRIYGEATSSQEGRYQYRRRGLLDDLPHVVLYKGVVIIRAQDEHQLLSELKQFDAEIQRRLVVLENSDVEALQEDDA